MKNFKCLLVFIFSFFLTSCDGQKNDNKNISNYKSEILSEDEMRLTTNKAIQLIQENNAVEFKNLFASEISQNIKDEQIKQLLTQLNIVFKNEGIPSGNENIIPSLKANLVGKDTIFINNISYNYKSSKALTFSFLKKFGPKKLVGVFLNENPLTSGNTKPKISKLEKFDFDVEEITQFRIYYDEGKIKKTKYKNEIGNFAIQGNAIKLQKIGIKPIIKSIFEDLKKSKYENVEVFNNTLQRGENPKYIQAEFSLKNKPYSIFIYLPLENAEKFDGKIIFMQKEYQNLGYQFTLSQNEYQKIIKEFPKIIALNLENYYEEKP